MSSRFRCSSFDRGGYDIFSQVMCSHESMHYDLEDSLLFLLGLASLLLGPEAEVLDGVPGLLIPGLFLLSGLP